LKWFAIVTLLMVIPSGGAQTLGRPHPNLLYTDADLQHYRSKSPALPQIELRMTTCFAKPKQLLSRRIRRPCRPHVLFAPPHKAEHI
jgi:hypothetical protein